MIPDIGKPTKLILQYYFNINQSLHLYYIFIAIRLHLQD